MITKRDLIVATILTFCITVALFGIIPISGQGAGDYDPWYDINDDGKIDMKDVGGVARKFGTSGTAINKTDLLLELLEKVDSLNASLVELRARFSVLESLPTNGLVGYWKFDEGEGTVAYDSSGYGNNGFLFGNASWVNGKFGEALWFGGGGSYVLVPHCSDLEFEGVHPFTLWAWIKPESPQGQTSLAANIVDKYSNYGLVYDHGNADARGVIFRSGGGWHHSGEVVISSGVWHHYVGVYDPPYLTAYLDGNEVARRNVGFLDLDTNLNNVVFGTNMQLTSQYNGIIDEVRIYNRTLSEIEIALHYIGLMP